MTSTGNASGLFAEGLSVQPRSSPDPGRDPA